MKHLSENSYPLHKSHYLISNLENNDLPDLIQSDVCMVILPATKDNDFTLPIDNLNNIIIKVIGKCTFSTMIIVGEIIDLIQCQSILYDKLIFHHLIAIKKEEAFTLNNSHLPNHHFGALIYTKNQSSLKHSKTRIAYSYCPVCEKTTKDYGGKKHTYDEFGTLISDVWRDTPFDLSGDLESLINRFSDLFGVYPNKELAIIQLDKKIFLRNKEKVKSISNTVNPLPEKFTNKLINGDCIEVLKTIPSNSIDFAFVDPPYNLKKKYSGYSDDLNIKEYFDWCDEWSYELFRVLKPGRTLAILNIPLWSIRHFLFLQSIMSYQNWIVWDALSFPVRLIMPAHYAIICFSKGKPRKLPGFEPASTTTTISNITISTDALNPLADNYCLRKSCVSFRKNSNINDHSKLTDLWGDIHRLKHNSKRVDHPTQLPPKLMYRIIQIFTKPGEIVLDCFNGSGTTTLSAQQLDRKFLGIELSTKYWELSIDRHNELKDGEDPFRKTKRILTTKNSPVKRLRKQTYKVPKKTLQLDVKRIAKELGHTPSREEVMTFSHYPISYFDDYFISWGEVTAAARNTGMNENRKKNDNSQLSLFTVENNKQVKK